VSTRRFFVSLPSRDGRPLTADSRPPPFTGHWSPVTDYRLPVVHSLRVSASPTLRVSLDTRHSTLSRGHWLTVSYYWLFPTPDLLFSSGDQSTTLPVFSPCAQTASGCTAIVTGTL